MLEKYQEAISDTELLALKEEIALVDVRLSDLVSKVDTGEAGRIWDDARKALAGFKVTVMGGDAFKIRAELLNLSDLLDNGAQDSEIWKEIVTMIDKRRSLVESERKRLMDMEAIITSEQAVLLVTAMLDAVRRNVTDRATLTAVQTDLAGIFAANISFRAGSG